MASLEVAKDADYQTKFATFGYLRKQETSLKLSTIPPIIACLSIAYLYNPEYFATAWQDWFSISDDKLTIRNINRNIDQSAHCIYMNKWIESTSKSIATWTFKIHQDRNKRKLFVDKLGASTTEDDVRAVFSKYGEVEEVEKYLDPRTMNRYFAFVIYKYAKDCVRASYTPNQVIKGRKCTCMLAAINHKWNGENFILKSMSNVFFTIISKENEDDQQKRFQSPRYTFMDRRKARRRNRKFDRLWFGEGDRVQIILDLIKARASIKVNNDKQMTWHQNVKISKDIKYKMTLSLKPFNAIVSLKDFRLS